MTPSILAEVRGNLAASHIHALLDPPCPETAQIEFKSTLGEEDRLWSGDKLSDAGKQQVFSTAVGFANSLGGVLVVGVETKRVDTLDVASSLKPVPNIAALAKIITDSAVNWLDPQISRLEVIPVPSHPGATDGYLVVRTDASGLAPHAYRTRGAFQVSRRIGPSTIPLTMTDVRHLVLEKYFEGQGLKERISEARLRFEQEVFAAAEVLKPSVGGFLVAAIPTTTVPDVPRLVNNDVLVPLPPIGVINYADGQGSYTNLPQIPRSYRAILRGCQTRFDLPTHPTRVTFVRQFHQDGTVECMVIRRPSTNLIHLRDVEMLQAAAIALADAHRFRSRIGFPNLEYLVEVRGMAARERGSQESQLQIEINERSRTFNNQPLALPPQRFSADTNISQVLNSIEQDVFDALGTPDRRMNFEFRYQ